MKESLRYVSSEDKDQPKGSTVSWTNRLIINKIDDNYSRHNTPSRAHSLSKIVKDNCFGDNQLVIVVGERKNSVANACAIVEFFNTQCVNMSAPKHVTFNNRSVLRHM